MIHHRGVLQPSDWPLLSSVEHAAVVNFASKRLHACFQRITAWPHLKYHLSHKKSWTEFHCAYCGKLVDSHKGHNNPHQGYVQRWTSSKLRISSIPSPFPKGLLSQVAHVSWLIPAPAETEGASFWLEGCPLQRPFVFDTSTPRFCELIIVHQVSTNVEEYAECNYSYV